jgi:hypothetical protein
MGYTVSTELGDTAEVPITQGTWMYRNMWTLEKEGENGNKELNQYKKDRICLFNPINLHDVKQVTTVTQIT